MENSGMKRKSFGWTVEDSIACGICLEFLSAPVFQCINAHIICSACINKVPQGRCPVCRAGLNEKVGNKLMDKVLGCYHKVCKFEGCNNFFSLTNIETHQSSCIFNDDIRCPVMWADMKLNEGFCSDTFPLNKLDMHLKAVHKLNLEIYKENINLKFCDDLSLIDKPTKTVDSKYIAVNGRNMLCSVIGEAYYCIIRIVPLHKDEKTMVRLCIEQGEHACTMEKNTLGLKSLFNHADFLLSYAACELYCVGNYLNCTIDLVKI